MAPEPCASACEAPGIGAAEACETLEVGVVAAYETPEVGAAEACEAPEAAPLDAYGVRAGACVAVSACLLGEPCRYDGASKPCERVQALAAQYELIPICPEAEGGLPTPRVPSEIVRSPEGRRVMSAKGVDVTAEFEFGARLCLEKAHDHACELAILKTKSPSCGNGLVYDGTFSGTLVEGRGVAAELFLAEGMRVVGEDAL